MTLIPMDSLCITISTRRSFVPESNQALCIDSRFGLGSVINGNELIEP